MLSRSALLLLAAGGSAALPSCPGSGSPVAGDSDRLEACARARGGRVNLAALSGVRVVGTLAHFDPAGAELAGEPLNAFLRFPDRARFEFGSGRALRILLLRGAEGFERSERSTPFVPLTGAAAEAWGKNVALHVILATFPLLPPTLSVGWEGDSIAVRGAGPTVRIGLDAATGLPSSFRFEDQEEESFRVEGWRHRDRGVLFPSLLRCEVAGRRLWEERIGSWHANPMMLDALFEPPPVGSPPPPPSGEIPLEATRIAEEVSFGLASARTVQGERDIAGTVAALRTGALGGGRVLLICDEEGSVREVAVVATAPGIAPIRTIEGGSVAEVSIRADLRGALALRETLGDFARERGYQPRDVLRILREPDVWDRPLDEEALFRLVLPLRRR